MPVSDIIGTNPAGEVVIEDGTPESQGYYGLDPELAKHYFGLWSISQVALGTVIGIFNWHVDNNNSNTSTYEKMWRVLTLSMVLAYLPAAIGWFYQFKYLDEETATLEVLYTYYLLNFVSIIGPMLGYFLVAYYYILCLH